MKRLFFWGRLLLGGLLVAFLFYSIDLREVQAMSRRASPALLASAYLIGVLDRILMAYKWNILLRAQEIFISLADATMTYLTATFLGLFLPATVGGDAMRIVAVSRRGFSTADTASTIIIERGLGLLALMFMVVASILVGAALVGAPFMSDLSTIFIWIVFLGALGSILLWLSFSTQIQEGTSWLGNFFRTGIGAPGFSADSKLGRFFANLIESYQKYRHQPGLLVGFFLLSLFENLFPIAWSYMLAMAFQLQVSLLDCFVVVPVVLILRRLPLSIDGIGIHESAFVSLLQLTSDVPEAQGLLLGITTHLLAIGLVLPGGLFYMMRGFKRHG